MPPGLVKFCFFYCMPILKKFLAFYVINNSSCFLKQIEKLASPKYFFWLRTWVWQQFDFEYNLSKKQLFYRLFTFKNKAP